MKLDDFPEVTRTEFENLIDEHIFNEVYRQILKRRFLDGHTFDKLADEFNFSLRHIKNIVYKQGDKLLKYLR